MTTLPPTEIKLLKAVSDNGGMLSWRDEAVTPYVAESLRARGLVALETWLGNRVLELTDDGREEAAERWPVEVET